MSKGRSSVQFFVTVTKQTKCEKFECDTAQDLNTTLTNICYSSYFFTMWSSKCDCFSFAFLDHTLNKFYF